MKQDVTDIKKEVQELLNKIVVLTEGVKKPQQVENYNYQYIFVDEDTYNEHAANTEDGEAPTDVNGKTLVKPNNDEVYLYCVQEYAKRVLEGNASDAAHNESQYYNSNC